MKKMSKITIKVNDDEKSWQNIDTDKELVEILEIIIIWIKAGRFDINKSSLLNGAYNYTTSLCSNSPVFTKVL